MAADAAITAKELRGKSNNFVEGRLCLSMLRL